MKSLPLTKKESEGTGWRTVAKYELEDGTRLRIERHPEWFDRKYNEFHVSEKGPRDGRYAPRGNAPDMAAANLICIEIEKKKKERAKAARKVAV